MTIFQKLLSTNAPAAVILIRLIIGGVFLSEGIQKFLLPVALGVGRFTKIGIPAPEIMAPFVGVCEIVCGVFFVLGLLTRLRPAVPHRSRSASSGGLRHNAVVERLNDPVAFATGVFHPFPIENTDDAPMIGDEARRLQRPSRSQTGSVRRKQASITTWSNPPVSS